MGLLSETNFRNGLLLLSSKEFETHGNLDIKMEKMLPTETMNCNTSPFEYDNCFYNETQTILENLCATPFLDNVRNITKCRNFKEGYNATQVYINRATTECQKPCDQVHVQISINQVMPIYQYLNPNEETSPDPGYHFKIPSSVRVSEMKEDYNWVSYIAEAGGWSGLFTGISVLSLVGIASAFIKTSYNSGNNIDKYLKALTLFLGIVVLAFVCKSAMSKLMKNPVGTDISFNSDYSDLSFSVCKEKSIYNYKENGSYQGNAKQFWNIKTNLVDYLRYINVTLKNGTVQSLLKRNNYYASFDILMKDKLNSYILPNSEDKIEFCLAFDVDKLQQIQIGAYSEVFLYLYHKNQSLFQQRKTRITALPAKSIEKDKNRNRIYLYNKHSAVKLNYIIGVGNSFERDSIDSCILNYIYKRQDQLNTTLFNHKNMDEENEMTEMILKQLNEGLTAAKEICPAPVKYIKADIQTENSIQKIPIIQNFLDTPIDILAENDKRDHRWVVIRISLPNFALIFEVSNHT